MSRAARLAAHVVAAPDREPIWGVDDCSAWAATWVALETGRAPRLPAYATRDEADRLIAAAGGLAPLWRRALAPLGLYETCSPDYGDVGVITTSRGEAGVIFTAGGFCWWRARAGALLLAPRAATIVAAWTVPERPAA